MPINQYIKQKHLDSPDLRDFFKNVLEEAIEISKAEEGGIVLRNDRTGELRVEVFIGEGVAQKKRIIEPDPNESICAVVADSKQILNIPNVKEDSRFHSLSNSKILSELVVPILYGNRCNGLINLESTRLNAFSDDIKQRLYTYAQKMSSDFHSVLIDYYRYFLEQQLGAVRDITEFTLLNMESPILVLQKILDYSLKLTEADTGGILLISDDKETLDIKVNRGLKQEHDTIKLKRGEGVVWKCVEENRPLNIWNIHEFKDIYKHLSEPDINSELAVPLSFHDNIFGVINIESSNYNAFGFEHEQTLAMFAQQVALLFHLTQLRKRWEGAWAIARWGDLSDNLAHRMNNLIGGVDALADRIGKMSKDPKIEKYANKIKVSTNEALTVVDDYRKKFSWKEDQIDICSTIKEAILKMTLPNNIKINVNIPNYPIIISIPDQQVRELCRELIWNACKYMGDKGEIEVSLSYKLDVLVLKVLDSGPGFSSNDPTEYFNLGARGSDQSKGTGYGLWWIQQFINALGGEISLQNSAEGGGLVVITIPSPLKGK